MYMQGVYTNYSGQMMDNYLLLVPGLVGCMHVATLQSGDCNLFARYIVSTFSPIIVGHVSNAWF